MEGVIFAVVIAAVLVEGNFVHLGRKFRELKELTCFTRKEVVDTLNRQHIKNSGIDTVMVDCGMTQIVANSVSSPSLLWLATTNNQGIQLSFGSLSRMK